MCDHDVLCVSDKDVQCTSEELTVAPPGDEKLCYATDRGDYPDLEPKNTMHACGNNDSEDQIQWSYFRAMIFWTPVSEAQKILALFRKWQKTILPV